MRSLLVEQSDYILPNVLLGIFADLVTKMIMQTNSDKNASMWNETKPARIITLMII